MRQFVIEETLIGMMAYQRTSNITATALLLAADLLMKLMQVVNHNLHRLAVHNKVD